MRLTKTPELALFTALFLAFGCQSDGSDLDDDSSADDDDSEGDDDDGNDDDGDDDSVSNSVSDSDASSGDDSGGTSAGTVDTGDTGGTTGDTGIDETTGDPTGDPTGDTDDASTGEQPGNTIYEVQDGTLAEDDFVEIIDVVVTGIALNGIFVQEPAGGEYSGVFVFSGMGGPDTSDAQVGDVIEFSGVIDEYYEFTQVRIDDGTYVNNGAGDALVPDVVDTATLADLVTGEAWESVLVRIEGDFSVTDINKHNEINVVDSGDELLIDNYCYEVLGSDDFDGLTVGSEFTAVQGPLNFSFDNFKIAPRSADDLEGFAP
jgi:predicted extracellular nuclease